MDIAAKVPMVAFFVKFILLHILMQGCYELLSDY